MRPRPARAARALGCLAAAAVLAAGAAPAHAATGVLAVNGAEHTDPRGCLPLEAAPAAVDNRTDQTVFVLAEPDCTGEVTAVLLPGEADPAVRGAAVYAP
ncbi:hypothetical protein ACFPZ0_14230 [Streptomonospora nanhaiensis]|uniref:Secreted protein n=1 Tax=Streptomonospora nanhaiensis TaxID=1323731 RepID=A0A853BKG7_9ACTN|nr:hypothetical protein [Streptomonospora nanhaiensis]MBV2362323.1 hypothetical protein [Streptomonospora nanhaiensis]MBX9388201.1 hypothetical protein [Streptomonospora nanhaiensis]NYI95022.1 hypothetical protein [Streptomonospora nanhaiensis]